VMMWVHGLRVCEWHGRSGKIRFCTICARWTYSVSWHGEPPSCRSCRRKMNNPNPKPAKRRQPPGSRGKPKKPSATTPSSEESDGSEYCRKRQRTTRSKTQKQRKIPQPEAYSGEHKNLVLKIPRWYLESLEDDTSNGTPVAEKGD